VKAHSLTVTGRVDEVVGERDPVEDLGIALAVAGSRRHLPQGGAELSDPLRVGRKVSQGRENPRRNRRVFEFGSSHLHS